MELILQKGLSHQEKPVQAISEVFNDVRWSDVSLSPYENPLIDFAASELNSTLKKVIGRYGGIQESLTAPTSSCLNLDIKMETGTGKTYVYTNIIYQLHKQFGINKFVICVPSLPIKAGTAQFIADDYVQKHFHDTCSYGSSIELGVLKAAKKKKGKQYFPSVVRAFVEGSRHTADRINVLLVNTGLLRNGTLLSRDDYDYGVQGYYSPLDAIRSVHPFVIIDEPHRFSREDKTFRMIEERICPQCIIRFGATFPKINIGSGRNRQTVTDYLLALTKKKAVTIIGPRQVGKSTLVREIFGKEQDALFLSGDEADIRAIFHSTTSTRLKAIIGKATTLIIDEAQKIDGIGNTLKLITDHLDGVKVIATVRSAFRLGKELNESLAGRKREIKLYPLSFSEMVSHTGLIEERRMLEQRLVYGYYPEVVTSPSEEKPVLKELVDSYLFKDIFEMDSVAKPDSLVKLLQALSFQIGSQVSYNELSQLVGIDSKTVSRYIELLERNFIVFRLPSFSRNLRNELKFSRKIYFYDLGIRNSIINNFAPVELRGSEELGRLWENFMISERLKYNEYKHRYATCYFWRTEQQKEIDLIEEMDGQLDAFEFKWHKAKKTKIPSAFAAGYPDTSFKTITPENFEEFILT